MGAIVGSAGPGSGTRLRAAVRLSLACGVLTTVVGCAWIDAKQRELVYRPTPGRPADFVGLREGDQSYLLEVPGADAAHPDRLQLWWLPQPDPQAPTLLYLH